MAKKTVKFTQKGISKLPNNKPIVYKIKTESGTNNYTGVTKKGRVQERLQEHLQDGKISGTKVQIEQKETIAEAEKAEANIIARSKPKYNKQGK